MDHIAVDIGASGGKLFSGKIISGGSDSRKPARKIEINEIYRFDNQLSVINL